LFKNSIQQHVRERFFVTPKVGMNFSGVLYSTCKHYHVFVDVKIHPPDDKPQEVAGQLFIQHGQNGNVAYMQRLLNVDG